MSENENADCNLPIPKSGSPKYHAKPTFLEMALETMQFPPDWDCDAWLRCNDIDTPEKLADLHYAVHKRCSRGMFQVSNISERQFTITGENSTLTIPHDGMRDYMISQLRNLNVRVMRRTGRTNGRGAK